MTGASTPRGRQHVPLVAVLSLYFPMYDEQMPADFHAEREAFFRRVQGCLATVARVAVSGMLITEGDAAKVNEQLRAARPEVVVLVPSMVAPPVLVTRALRGVDAPVLIWDITEVDASFQGLTQPLAAARSAHVGCEMAANVLRRDGKFFFSVGSSIPPTETQLERLSRSMRALAVASLLRRAMVLRVGEHQAGYDDIEAGEADLRRLGAHEQVVSLPAWEEALRSVTPEELADVEGELAARQWQIASGAEREGSVRIAAALAGLAARFLAPCGTVNCHGPYFRDHPEVGLTACLGVSLLTARGTPFSCTGDLPAALALLLGQRLSGAGLYCEFYTAETATGEMFVASGGEGDPAWARPGSVRLMPNRMYPGVRGEGTAIAFPLVPGPATVLSLSPGPERWRVTWATGAVTERSYPDFDGPHGGFRFDSGDAVDAGARWVAAGPSHHHVLATGRLDVELPLIAAAAGIEEVRV